MAYQVSTVKVSFGKETTPGTLATLTDTVPFTEDPKLQRTIDSASSPMKNGQSMTTGKYVRSASVEGSLSIDPRVTTGFTKLLKGALTKADETPVQIGDCISIMYTGSSDSCKIVADSTGKTIKAYVGVAGSEILDTNFATSGSMDLTDVLYNTPTKIVAAINGYTGYKAIVKGTPGTSVSDKIISKTTNIAGKMSDFYFSSTTSKVYQRYIVPQLDNTERDTFTIQIDGKGDNIANKGCVVDKVSLSGSSKGEIKGTIDIIGMNKIGSQTASTTASPTGNTLVFANGITAINGVVYTVVHGFSLSMANNHNKDFGYGQGSIDRMDTRFKGAFQVSGDCTVQMDIDSQALVELAENCTPIPMVFTFIGGSLGNGMREVITVELPYCLVKVDPSANGDVYENKISFEAVNPSDKNIDGPFIVSIVDNVSTVL